MSQNEPTTLTSGRQLPECAPAMYHAWLDRTRAALRAARSTETISRWVVEGKLHPVKVGGVILFDPEEIDSVDRARTIGYLAGVSLRAIESGNRTARIETL